MLARENLPSAKPPNHLLGIDYDFPTDPNQLTSLQLGTLRLELSALRGYAERLLGEKEIYLHELELVFDYMVGTSMLTLARSDAFKGLPRAAGVKEVLRYQTIDSDDILKRLFHRIVEMKSEVEIFRLQFNIYEGHLQALSREQSRRESETRFGIP